MKDEVKSRLYINTVKGLAIFLMLWGHCIQCCALNSFDFFENNVFKFIYSFHMPLFMLVSGYLFYFSFQKRDVKELIVHRTKPLGWTIVVGGIIIWLSTTVLFNFLTGNYSVIIGGGWLPFLNKLWFLWSVLASSLGVALIFKKVKPLGLQILLLFVWGGVVLLFPNAENNLYMYPYYVIGFCFAKIRNKICNKLLYIKYLSLLLFPAMCFFFEKRHYIYTSGIFGGEYVDGIWNIVKTDMFRWAIGLMGSIFVLTVVEFLFNLFYRPKSTGVRKKLFMPLAKVGGNSLQIYVLSSIFLSGYLPIAYHKCIELLGEGNFLANNMWLYNAIFTPILAIVYTIFLYWIVKLLYKIKIGEFIFLK